MQTLLWFCVILLLTLLYGMRIKRVVGYVESPLVRWYFAVVLGVGLFFGAWLVTRFDVVVPALATTMLHGILMFVGAWLGIRYWFAWKPWDAPAMFLAAILVAFYVADPVSYNNIMFGAVTLGCAVGGYYMSKSSLLALCSCMAVFDGYAVWGSDMMDQLLMQQPGPFPSELLVGSFFPSHFSIGVMDALLAGLVIVGLVHHRTATRALAFICAYAGVVFVIGLLALPLAMHGITWLTQVPLLVVLAPLTWMFLFLRVQRHRASPKA